MSSLLYLVNVLGDRKNISGRDEWSVGILIRTTQLATQNVINYAIIPPIWELFNSRGLKITKGQKGWFNLLVFL